MSGDAVRFEGWTAREEVVHDELGPTHARAVAAMLDRPDRALAAGAPLPPLWHWFYFPTLARRSELGDDGHPRRGGLLPPVPLPRRMWAGGRLRFHAPPLLGEPAERRSVVRDVQEKQGRSGRFFVVTVEHRIVQRGELRVEEEQDLVYRPAARPQAGEARAGAEPPAGAAALPEAEWERRFTPDAVLLFRFSALTFNGHRIHYDWRYATGVEGYRGLVVHGPLTALLLLQHAAEQAGRVPARFEYRALAPLFCDEAATIGARAAGADGVEVWARTPGGGAAMRASVAWCA